MEGNQRGGTDSLSLDDRMTSPPRGLEANKEKKKNSRRSPGRRPWPAGRYRGEAGT